MEKVEDETNLRPHGVASGTLQPVPSMWTRRWWQEVRPRGDRVTCAFSTCVLVARLRVHPGNAEGSAQ
ncbi:hypothetical protein D4764_01G0000810 [Takifugu flavidus]|uniref:Uncharacterized protein n=1 Tax=Takifugu flavidus TaxID=433684 RepID=A0A5C6PMZ8_9TELE|nr:hypothetical protein D4764_01G0000810 [Takifugu flavidus]